MSQYAEFVNDLGDRITESLERLQEFQLEQIRTWQTGLGQIAAVAPMPQFPGSENIPSFESVVKANFSLAERLLQNQRKFALSVSEVLETPAEEDEAEA